MTRQADWYFDFVAPFAYLQFAGFESLPGDLAINLKPVLFQGAEFERLDNLPAAAQRK